MNRAERRQLAKCHHVWDVKQMEWKDFRHCRKCGFEEQRGRLVPLSRCQPLSLPFVVEEGQ